MAFEEPRIAFEKKMAEQTRSKELEREVVLE